MSPIRASTYVAIPLALAALELAHPTWPGASPSRAVAEAGAWWLILHLALIVGYALLVWTLWELNSRLGRAALATFLVSNTAFLAVEGLGVGLLASTDPSRADALWNSQPVVALAELTGASWAAALFITAQQSSRGSRFSAVGLSLAWLAFLASSIVLPRFVSFAITLAVAAYQVYRNGAAGLPFALLAIAAILPQHVGAEAAVGMLCIALARADLLRGRSTPAASSPP